MDGKTEKSEATALDEKNSEVMKPSDDDARLPLSEPAKDTDNTDIRELSQEEISAIISEEDKIKDKYKK